MKLTKLRDISGLVLIFGTFVFFFGIMIFQFIQQPSLETNDFMFKIYGWFLLISSVATVTTQVIISREQILEWIRS